MDVERETLLVAKMVATMGDDSEEKTGSLTVVMRVVVLVAMSDDKTEKKSVFLRVENSVFLSVGTTEMRWDDTMVAKMAALKVAT